MIFLLKYWKYIAIGLVVIGLVILYNRQLSIAYDRGVTDTKAQWVTQSLLEAEEAKQKVDALKRKFAEEAEADKANRDRQEQEDNEQRAKEQAQRDQRISELMHKLNASKECSEWQKLPFACRL